jgi:hypothetical protein
MVQARPSRLSLSLALTGGRSWSGRVGKKSKLVMTTRAVLYLNNVHIIMPLESKELAQERLLEALQARENPAHLGAWNLERGPMQTGWGGGG